MNQFASFRLASSRLASSSGFTLVELLLALSLATLLIVGLLGIASRFAAHRRQLQNDIPLNDWQTRLETRLAADFENCQSVFVRSRQLVFIGFSYRDLTSGTHRHLPSEVTYEIAQTEAGAILVRTEKHSSEPPGENEAKEIMCTGLESIELSTRLDTDVPPNALQLVLRGAIDGREAKFPMVLVRHGVGE